MAVGPSVTESVLSVGNRIGRYFSLTSLLPTLLLVLWIYLLARSDAWVGQPDPSQALQALRSWSVADVAWAILVTFVVASFTHALQFPLTQLLEGYWRSTGFTGRLQAARVQHYRNLRHRLRMLDTAHQEALYADGRNEEAVEDLLRTRLGDPLMRHVLGRQDVTRRRDRLPAEPQRTMPTRLGNVLRRYEDLAGSQYGMSVISVMPHLLLIAPKSHVDYVDDARQEMDTSIRLVAISLTATLASVLFLATDGWWLLLALVPYALAYVAYRGSVASAVEYGVALCTIIDLDRFMLYETFRLPTPHSLSAERRLNEKLMKLINFDSIGDLRYVHRPRNG